MAVLDICIAFYVLTTAVAIGLTYRERCRSGRTSLAVNALSLLACMAWPLLAAVFLGNALVAGQGRAAQG